MIFRSMDYMSANIQGVPKHVYH